ncbi:hypothetical protein YB2330_000384 [Saitoella coloradoensis]
MADTPLFPDDRMPKSSDPWAKRNAWRTQGPFTARARWSRALPGLPLGVGAFIVYCAVEWAQEKYGDAKPAHH